jgi:hypothetical protein
VLIYRSVPEQWCCGNEKSSKGCEFMKNADVDEILANKDLWGEDLSSLSDDLKGMML